MSTFNLAGPYTENLNEGNKAERAANLQPPNESLHSMMVRSIQVRTFFIVIISGKNTICHGGY